MAHGYRFPYLVWLGHRAWNNASRTDPFEVFVYNDDEDDPDDRAWMDEINTEPDDGNYSRATVNFGANNVASYNKEVGIEFGDVLFDITNTTGRVDSFGIAAELEYFSGMGRDNTYSPGEMVEVFVGSGPLEEPIVLDDYSGDWTVETGTSLAPLY